MPRARPCPAVWQRASRASAAGQSPARRARRSMSSFSLSSPSCCLVCSLLCSCFPSPRSASSHSLIPFGDVGMRGVRAVTTGLRSLAGHIIPLHRDADADWNGQGPNPADVVLAAVTPEQAEFYANVVKTGAVFLKFGRRGTPHDRFVKLSDDLKEVTWREVKTGGMKKTGSMAVAEWIAIRQGQATVTFRKYKGGNTSTCLSIVARTRSLDLKAATTEERDIWANALSWVLSQRDPYVSFLPPTVIRFADPASLCPGPMFRLPTSRPVPEATCRALRRLRRHIRRPLALVIRHTSRLSENVALFCCSFTPSTCWRRASGLRREPFSARPPTHRQDAHGGGADPSGRRRGRSGCAR